MGEEEGGVCVCGMEWVWVGVYVTALSLMMVQIGLMTIRKR